MLRRVGLVLERVNHRDVRFDFDGLAVENGGAVAPLGHSVLGGVQEERIAADDLQGLNRPISGDDRTQLDLAFLMNLSRERRVYRLNSSNQHR